MGAKGGGKAPEPAQEQARRAKALISAIDGYDDHEVERLLASGADPNGLSGRREDSPLIAACFYDPSERPVARKIVKALVAAGASLGQGSTGWSALGLACYNAMPLMVDLLLSLGSDPNESAGPGAPPLARAALSQSREPERVAIVAALLASGADPGWFARRADQPFHPEPDSPAQLLIASVLQAREISACAAPSRGAAQSSRL